MKHISIEKPLYPVGARFREPGTGHVHMVGSSNLSYRGVFVDDDERYISWHYLYSMINVDSGSSELGFGMLVIEVTLTEQWTRLEDGTE